MKHIVRIDSTELNDLFHTRGGYADECEPSILGDRKEDASNNSEHLSNKIFLTEKISKVLILINQSLSYHIFFIYLFILT